MRRKRKIAIVGAGLGGCVTAMHYQFYGRDIIDKIDIYHDPNSPMEKVGQGTTPNISSLLFFVHDNRWHNEEWNKVKATIKLGSQYEGWGKRDVFHHFSLNTIAQHYIPELLSKTILESGVYNVIEKNIDDPEKEIDSDVIFDCRGRKGTNPEDYYTLDNPLNAVLLGRREGREPELQWTKSVATPDGWTFVIPNHDSVSYGYLYNSNITSKEDATKNMIELFDIEPNDALDFNNYVAKNIFRGERTVLNGNRVGFLEPLEATSGGFYKSVAEYGWDHFIGHVDKRTANARAQKMMKSIATFILWHYGKGSYKYDTPFWQYAMKMWKDHTPYGTFDTILERSRGMDHIDMLKDADLYGQWYSFSFKQWEESYQEVYP